MSDVAKDFRVMIAMGGRERKMSRWMQALANCKKDGK